MATLSSIAEGISFELGQQFNAELNEDLKNRIVELRAKFIRQDLDRNNFSYTDYLSVIEITFETAQSFEPNYIKGSYILKSKTKIPKPLRIKNNGRIPFKFVGSLDREKPFTFALKEEAKFFHPQNLKNTVYYSYIEDYIIILNNEKVKKAILEYIIADPREFKNCYETDEELNFPIPEDMLYDIRITLIKEYGNLIGVIKQETVNTESDGK